MARTTWSHLDEAQLLAQCAVDTYRASGPGGQKRNKTSSAVRLRHQPSGLIVIAEESRSQHENKARALLRLRQALFLHLREAVPADRLAAEGMSGHEDFRMARSAAGRLDLGRRAAGYWPAVGVVLDVLEAVEGRVGEAGAALGVSTGNLIDFLQSDPRVWQQANLVRSRFGHKPLR